MTQANLLIIISILLATLFTFQLKKQRKRSTKLSTIERFKQSFTGRNHLKSRLAENNSNILVANPEVNIKIGTWDGERELREKADIHRTRLMKFGRSRMNGEMLFMGKEGRVFRITPQGDKKYL